MSAEQRFILFEVAGGAYAIPIDDVAEVSECAPAAGIPGLPTGLAGVVNLHGDALPVLSREALFGLPHEPPAPPTHVLVLAGRGDRGLGLPVDRVLGLEDGPAVEAGSATERRPMRGRVVTLVDARRMLARAESTIGAAFAPQAGARERGAHQGG